jgi:hypothetical protein
MTDRISAADQLVLLLRQRLAEHSQAQRKTKEAGKAVAGRQPAAAHAIQALAAAEGVDDRLLKRAIVQNLLAERFGTTVVNDAEFQQVVDKVVTTLGDHAGGGELLARMVREMRAAAK